jgi:predicted transcriptional regulator
MDDLYTKLEKIAQTDEITRRLLNKITVVKNGCWVWRGAMSSNRPVISLRRYKINSLRPARYLYQKLNGPLNGVIKQTCNTPRCVKPTDYSITKKIIEKEGIAKRKALKIERAKEVLELHANGMQGKDIAKKFGIDKADVSRIINGKNYSYLQTGEISPKPKKFESLKTNIIEGSEVNLTIDRSGVFTFLNNVLPDVTHSILLQKYRGYLAVTPLHRSGVIVGHNDQIFGYIGLINSQKIKRKGKTISITDLAFIEKNSIKPGQYSLMKIMETGKLVFRPVTKPDET